MGDWGVGGWKAVGERSGRVWIGPETAEIGEGRRSGERVGLHGEGGGGGGAWG